jgi:adenylate kinase
MKQCIVFLGKTGAGKDTQAGMLEAKYGIRIMRIGDLVRDVAKSNTHIADELAAGKLVDDPVVDVLMKKAVSALKKDEVFVSDGYPRHLKQAHTLETVLAKADAKLIIVIYFALSDSDARLRLKLRNRSDDTPDAILQRLTEFHMSTETVIDYFRDNKKLLEIDASKSPDEVFANLVKNLEKAGIVLHENTN